MDFISLLKEKKEEGLHQLELEYGTLIRYIIRGVLYNYPQESEECYNDILMKCWDKIHEFDSSKSSFKTYLSKLSRNAAIDTYRKITSSQQKDSLVKDQLKEKLKEPPRQTAPASANLLSNCTETEKDLFLRKYYYQQSVAQIAAEYHVSVRSIEGQLYRLRKKIAKQLAEGGKNHE